MRFVSVVAVSALAFGAGMRADESLRDPLTLLLFVMWLVAFGWALVSHDPRAPR